MQPISIDGPLILDLDGPIARITLDRPERGNALSAELVEALIKALAEAFASPAVHTLMLCGSGKHFCTGFELGNIEASSDGDLLHRFVRIETALAMLWEAPVRTVAFAKGKTWGAGADLFTACDVRVASASASFRFPGAGFGLVLGTRRLVERVGADRARHWATTTVEFTDAEALEAGLATDCLAENLAPDAWISSRTAPAVSQATLRALNRASRSSEADRDLANLVRSAAQPGLRDRIISYSSQRRRRNS